MKTYLVSVIWLLLSINISAQEFSPYNSQQQNYQEIIPVSGLFIGYGTSYGGLGLAYLLKVGRFGISIGVGYFPAFGFNPTEDAELDESLLASVGLKFYVYKSLHLNAQYGIFSYLYKSEKDYYSATNFIWTEKYGGLYGPSLMFGGDFSLGGRWGLNLDAGVSFNMNSDFDEYKTWPAIDFGFIYRI